MNKDRQLPIGISGEGLYCNDCVYQNFHGECVMFLNHYHYPTRLKYNETADQFIRCQECTNLYRD